MSYPHLERIWLPGYRNGGISNTEEKSRCDAYLRRQPRKEMIGIRHDQIDMTIVILHTGIRGKKKSDPTSVHPPRLDACERQAVQPNRPD